ncbi:UDP-N-acetylglucosamine 1-carboxyvinyltransferase [Rhodospirillaceae bacterium]|jgi:UDP-N-acetylglucosamine 1-carboxyvinyltransferase|nr:UDP-N-acetylglucosamine 1-carboxyvinyltransferase [Rhodospirillaceae bacterium]MBT5912284.1 UDP-N-acetylglucosamine 1-carboxyvinyltransferase [Rhodospirillaceae bacterium]MDC1441192.1 UDP-N-acetylglucosamine 1-carboxyvinyltransferase [Rhodospirillaceae bacterium]
MENIIIRGGESLSGQIPISGAKNSALPLMATTLLTKENITLRNVPALDDIISMRDLLKGLGSEVLGDLKKGGAELTLNTNSIKDTEAPYELVRKMRASVLVLGPLLARCGHARVSLPGGCAIGNRPVDIHLSGLEQMGVSIDLKGGYIDATIAGNRRLKGARIAFPMVSVGATENLLMAATLAQGETELINAAREPEIIDLANCLISMGAKIQGHGTDTILISGVEALNGAEHRVISDRIEIGTYAIAACITGGQIDLLGADGTFLRAVFDTLRASGAEIDENNWGLRIIGPKGKPKAIDIMTDPYPGFPTDLQAQMMAYMTRVSGASMITETIFENRFMHVPELRRMGADINVHNSTALVRGVSNLKGAPVMATDLRASVSLVLAGLAADGVTEISRIYHLDRGYEDLVGKLVGCGAHIKRI